jgi:hypothetical protein
MTVADRGRNSYMAVHELVAKRDPWLLTSHQGPRKDSAKKAIPTTPIRTTSLSLNSLL